MTKGHPFSPNPSVDHWLGAGFSGCPALSTPTLAARPGALLCEDFTASSRSFITTRCIEKMAFDNGGRGYVPPHLRNVGNGGNTFPSNFGGQDFRAPVNGAAGGFRGGHGGGGGFGGGGRRYDNRGPPPPRGGGWGGGGADERDPFAEDAARKHEVDSLFQNENTGINFDAYEDIPVRFSRMTGSATLSCSGASTEHMLPSDAPTASAGAMLPAKILHLTKINPFCLAACLCGGTVMWSV